MKSIIVNFNYSVLKWNYIFEKLKNQFITIEEIYSILKSNTFLLTNYKGESCELYFTQCYVFRDSVHIADYEIKLVNDEFRISFDNVKYGDLSNVSNILFGKKVFKTILNPNKLELQQKGKFEYSLMAI